MSEPRKMRVYVTKYALTQGVLVQDVEARESRDGELVVETKIGPMVLHYQHNWHETRAEAEAQVAKMIAAKRKSLAKQLAALEKLAAGGVKWEEA